MSVSRRPLALLFKLVLGAAIVALIIWKLPIRDGYWRDGEFHTGRHVQIDPAGGTLQITTASDERREVALSSGAQLLITESGLVLRQRGATDLALKAAAFAGTLQLETDAGIVQIPLHAIDTEERVSERSGVTEIAPRIQIGIETIVRRLDAVWILLASLLILVSLLLGALRWELLVRAQDLDLGLAEAIRLSFIGLFFNNVVPGSTGGDVVKAVLLARRHGEHKAKAITSVIVDRVMGLFVLAGCAAIIMLFDLQDYADLAFILWAILGAGALGTCVFLSRRVRRLLRVDRLLKRLPAAETLKALDDALVSYRRRPRALWCAALLSLAAQACFVGAVVMIGLDLGLDATAGVREPVVLTYVMTLPCIFIVSALPVLPGGWGLGEAAYAYFFSIVGVANFALPVALSVITRAALLLFSLVGGLLLLKSHESTQAPDSAAQ